MGIHRSIIMRFGINYHLYLHQQAIDTTTPSGRAMFQMCGVFAEFERSMIVERVNAGLARAKASGVKLGRGNRKDHRRSADEKGGMSLVSEVSWLTHALCLSPDQDPSRLR